LGSPYCNYIRRLRPGQEFIDSPSVIYGNPNLKVLDMHAKLRA
jgi:hypothetical protein